MHTLKNEYPAFGGRYNVIHHTQLINELLEERKIVTSGGTDLTIAFHDPCYLGRQNQIIDEPRQVLSQTQNTLVELPRNRDKSFCCGAGGAQMWKEEENGNERVSAARFEEAQNLDADVLAVG